MFAWCVARYCTRMIYADFEMVKYVKEKITGLPLVVSTAVHNSKKLKIPIPYYFLHNKSSKDDKCSSNIHKFYEYPKKICSSFKIVIAFHVLKNGKFAVKFSICFYSVLVAHAQMIEGLRPHAKKKLRRMNGTMRFFCDLPLWIRVVQAQRRRRLVKHSVCMLFGGCLSSIPVVILGCVFF